MIKLDIFTAEDLIPVPCNPDHLTMGYALKIDNEIHPLTRWVDPDSLINNTSNTIVFEQDEKLKENIFSLFSTGTSVEAAESDLAEIMCCLPKINAPDLSYSNMFRIIIINFMDAYDFDLRTIKKSCVHIVHKDGRIIPFETMNMFYREKRRIYRKSLMEDKNHNISDKKPKNQTTRNVILTICTILGVTLIITIVNNFTSNESSGSFIFILISFTIVLPFLFLLATLIFILAGKIKESGIMLLCAILIGLIGLSVCGQI